MIRGAVCKKNSPTYKTKKKNKRLIHFITQMSSFPNAISSINYINNWNNYKNLNVDFTVNEHVHKLTFYFSPFVKSTIGSSSERKPKVFKSNTDLFLYLYKTDLAVLSEEIMNHHTPFVLLMKNDTILNIFNKSSLILVKFFFSIENNKKTLKFIKKGLYRSISDFIFSIVMNVVNRRGILKCAEGSISLNVLLDNLMSCSNSVRIFMQMTNVLYLIRSALINFEKELEKNQDYKNVLLNFIDDIKKQFAHHKISNVKIKKEIQNFILFFTSKKIILYSNIKFSYLASLESSYENDSNTSKYHYYISKEIFNGRLLIGIDRDFDKITISVEDHTNRFRKHISRRYSDLFYNT